MKKDKMTEKGRNGLMQKSPLKVQLYVRVDILRTRGKQLHYSIISLKGEIWIHITSLTPTLFI
jgi:hypothetical protein